MTSLTIVWCLYLVIILLNKVNEIEKSNHRLSEENSLIVFLFYLYLKYWFHFVLLVSFLLILNSKEEVIHSIQTITSEIIQRTELFTIKIRHEIDFEQYLNRRTSCRCLRDSWFQVEYSVCEMKYFLPSICVLIELVTWRSNQ